MATQRIFPRVKVDQIRVTGPDRDELVGEEFVEEAIRALGDREELIYNLNIRGLTEAGTNLTGRTYVRAKNLIEPDIIDVENEGVIDEEKVADTYRVNATISK